MTLNRRLPVPTQAPPQSQSGRPDLNRRSRAPEARGIPGFPTSCLWRAPSGSRTRTSALARRQAAATSWALGWKPNCQRTQSTGRESNPRRRCTGAESSPLDHQCGCSVGPVGIEPTSSGLRDRCITLSATVPNQSARRELNHRPGAYKAVALTPELSAEVFYYKALTAIGFEPKKALSQFLSHFYPVLMSPISIFTRSTG